MPLSAISPQPPTDSLRQTGWTLLVMFLISPVITLVYWMVAAVGGCAGYAPTICTRINLSLILDLLAIPIIIIFGWILFAAALFIAPIVGMRGIARYNGLSKNNAAPQSLWREPYPYLLAFTALAIVGIVYFLKI